MPKSLWVAISERRGVKLSVWGLLTTRFQQNNHDTQQRLTHEKNVMLISCACPQTIFILNLHLCPTVLIHFYRLTQPPHRVTPVTQTPVTLIIYYEPFCYHIMHVEAAQNLNINHCNMFFFPYVIITIFTI